MWRLLIAIALATASAPAAADPKPLKLGYDAQHLDLDKHVLQFKPSRPVKSATLTVIGEDGTQLGTGAATYDGKSTDWLAITWEPASDTRVLMLKLRVETGDGVATNLELTPWSVTIDHEDANFASDSAAIDEAEHAKLDASLAKIQDLVKKNEKFLKMKLWIAGHTDTVGSDAKNRQLSLARAYAIGSYFRDKGLTIPIAVAGFGESVLKVKTPQNTDERANRRADYVLGRDGGPPPFKGPYLKAHASWKAIK